MARYSITELFMVLACVSSISLALNTNGLKALFDEDVKLQFGRGRNDECIVTLSAEEEDTDTEKCYQTITVDPKDADEETWDQIVQNCDDRDVVFEYPKECDSIGLQKIDTCDTETIVVTECGSSYRYCCKHGWWKCKSYCERCSSYRTRHETRKVCS